ncbi:MAG TPA: hypothetical protein VE684_05555 [Crenalkalicoccus sp.]|nr:hypothetical protein [Crenalkalicoccus sp.]
MRGFIIPTAFAVLIALPAAAQQPTQQGGTAPTPGVPSSPHQNQVLRSHPSGEQQTGTQSPTDPTVSGGAAPASPHQQDVLRGHPSADQGSQQQGSSGTQQRR